MTTSRKMPIPSRYRLAGRVLDCQYAVHSAKARFYDEVLSLARQRIGNGEIRKADIADLLGKSPSWVTRTLGGPANWTLQTFAELVEALDGEYEIKVLAGEDARSNDNYNVYAALLGDQHQSTPSTQKLAVGGTVPISNSVNVKFEGAFIPTTNATPTKNKVEVVK